MTSYSTDAKYVAKLKTVEQQIAGGQLELAAQSLNALKKAHPQDPRIYLLGSCMAAAANNLEGELQLAQRAYQIAPDWSVGSIHLAKVMAKVGKIDDALLLAEQAVQLAARSDTGTDVLTQATVLADQLGDYEKTLRWLRQAEGLNPGDPAIRYKLANTLMATGDFVDAIAIFDDLVRLQPDDATLLSRRAFAYLGANQGGLALLDARTLIALEPENEEYKFFLAFAQGENPAVMPESHTRSLFDGYASKFDRELVLQLKYKLPRDVAAMIHAWHPDKKVDVLDLGCGTGLLGACLGRQEGVLVGVDLSSKMVQEAKRHQVYHRFHLVNLVDALEATPADLYHVIAALDVLIYVGELKAVMKDALRVLLPGGRFIFSCELSPGDVTDFTLQKTMRYTHTTNYVEGLLQNTGFVDVAIEQRVIRVESGAPVPGILVTACKPLQAAQKIAPRSPKSARKARSGQSPGPGL